MRIVLAPDSFKGSLTSAQAAAAMERGILRADPSATCVCAAIADGGEGTVDAIVAMRGGQLLHARVEGPLGAPVDAAFGICEDTVGRFAVLEMAAASGLLLTPEGERDILRASTFGTGQLIRAALDLGVSRLIIGIGGSATNDGGAGMAQALGARLLDDSGEELPRGGAALSRLSRIDASGLDPRLVEAQILVASDVTNPLCGPRGCSAVY
nr:glycerate kinase [Succinivibrionaceae bacterium]